MTANESDTMQHLRQTVVPLVHDAFQSTSTIFWLIDEKRRLNDPVMEAIQSQFLMPYKSYFFNQNPFDPSNLQICQRPSVVMEQLTTLADFHKTEYYNDFL
ncbi:MAG: hypothetical protein GY729_18990, partial [Desulfobacteraceae bacterium]|nr:hypothetical protein [Desulfobacteraceae bacterium]